MPFKLNAHLFIRGDSDSLGTMNKKDMHEDLLD